MGNANLKSLQLIGIAAGAFLVGLATFVASSFGASSGSTSSDQQRVRGESPPMIRLVRLGDRFRRPQPEQQVSNEATKLSININGSDRTYYLFSGTNSGSSTVPLLIMLHGGGGSATSSMKVTNLGQLGRAAGIDVIFPEGSNLGHPYRWNTGLKTGTEIDMVDDIAFLDKIVKAYSTGSRPIFLAGLSNGGMMAMRQLCEGNSRFTGAFIVAGGASKQLLQSCNSKVSLPILLVHGKMDSIVPYNGGLVARGGINQATTLSTTPLVSHERLFTFWLRRNRCSTQSSSLTQLFSLNSDPTVMIENLTKPLGTCQQTISVVMNEGDHGWPIDVRLLNRRQSLQLRQRQRLAGSLVGKESVNPGSLDTSGIVIRLIGRWAAQSNRSY
jgi:polyhydroxybutyrate depolymerase